MVLGWAVYNRWTGLDWTSHASGLELLDWTTRLAQIAVKCLFVHREAF